MVSRAFAIGLVLLLLPTALAAQSVRAVADRTTMSVGEELYVDVEYFGGGRAQLSEPEGDDFVVLGTSTMSSMEIVNGRRSSRLTFTVTMRPARTGQLTVGRFPVQVGGRVLYTEPIAVTVSEAPAPDRGGGTEPVRPTRPGIPPGNSGPSGRQAMPSPMSDLMFRPAVIEPGRDEPFLLATVSEVNPVVGQQFIIDFVLMRPDTVFFGLDSVELTEPEFENLWFEEITDHRSRGRLSRLPSVRVGRTRYTPTVIRAYAAFALEPGELIIPTMEFVVADRGLRSRGRRSTLRSRPLVLDVVAPPESGRPDGFYPGNVGAFELQASADVRQARAGDTVNVTIAVVGAGLLSRLDLPTIDGFSGGRVYPAEDSHTQAVGPDGWMRGTARRRIAVVPLEEGTLELPAVTLDSYDPWRGEYVSQTVELPRLRVVGQNPNVESVTEAEESPADDWLAQLPNPRPVRSSAPAPSLIGPVYWLGLAAPPTAFATALWLQRARRRREAGAGARQRAQAGKVALAAIEGADAGAIATAMRTYLADITGDPTRGLRLDAVRALVARLADAGTAGLFHDALEAAETARFSGADATTLAADASAAVQRLEAQR